MVRSTAPTLKDIATAAGVSAMAVSVALRGGDQGVRLASGTRERIQRIAADMGYQTNAVARALSNRKTDTIGLLSGCHQFNADSPFSAVILHGLQLGCADHQRDMLLYRGSLEPEGDGVAYRSLADGRVDGAILLHDQHEDSIAELDRRRLPLIGLGSNLPGIPFVG